MKRHSIKPHQPLRYLLLVLIASTLVGAGLWLLAEYSHWQLIREQMADNRDYKSLWQANKQLTRKNAALREELAGMQTGNSIDKRTIEELQVELGEMQDEIFQLKRELEFYRGIVSSSEDVKGMAVQALELQQVRNANQYRFKLVLTHVAKSDRVAEGDANIALLGTQDGKSRTLQMADIIRDQSLSFQYRFKHFKRFEGLIELPPAFKPQQVRVELLPKSNSHGRTQRVFDWSEVTG